MSQKLTARSALTTPINTDIIHVVDDPGGTPASYKSTLSDVSKGLVIGNIPDSVSLASGNTFEGAQVFNEAGADVDFRIEGVSAANALFVQGSDGFIGIGTDAPESLLHISGGNLQLDNNRVIKFDDAGGTARNVFEVTSGDDIVIGSSNLDDLKFNVGTVGTAVTIKQTTGNIGIGTDSPAQKLDIVGDGAAMYIQSEDYNNIILGRRGSSGVDLDKGSLFMYSEGTLTNFLDTAGNSYFNGGNVGIGTSSPGALLQVGDDADASANEIRLAADAANGRVTRYTFYNGGAEKGRLSYDYRTTEADSKYVFRVNASNIVAFKEDAVGIGTVNPSSNADLTLEGGVMCFKETTTPTADTDYGKIYTKTDNILYFQDGAGSEHSVDLDGGAAATLQTAFDQGQTITVADTDNQTLLITNNDTTNNPDAVQITATTTTADLLQVTSDTLTTGSLGYFYSNSADTGSRNLVDIVNDNTSAVNAVALSIQQDANELSLSISSLANTSTTAQIVGANTTSKILNIIGSSLTTGELARFYSSSASNGTRNLIELVNDNAAATGTTPLMISQNAVTSTNFKKMVDMSGTVIWISDGATTPNGNLSGTTGDMCLNGDSGNIYRCTGTTNWTAM
jgi:hypothetical protein